MLAFNQHRVEIPGDVCACVRQSLSHLPCEVHSRIAELLQPICQLLPDDECVGFARDPMRFVSQKCFFRAMGPEKVCELLRLAKMLPASGNYNGTAVFATDSPIAAAECMGNGSAFAVLEPECVAYLKPEHGLYDVSSQELKELEAQALLALPLEARILAAYTIIDRWDTRGPFASGTPWHTICLRKEQPIRAVRAIMVLHPEHREPAAYDPHDPADLLMLKQHFGVLA